jgi:hypothetical protein
MVMCKIIIDMETEKSADFLMGELLEKYPLLDGRVRKYQEPEITTLDKLIKKAKKENK